MHRQREEEGKSDTEEDSGSELESFSASEEEDDSNEGENYMPILYYYQSSICDVVSVLFSLAIICLHSFFNSY